MSLIFKVFCLIKGGFGVSENLSVRSARPGAAANCAAGPDEDLPPIKGKLQVWSLRYIGFRA